MIILGIETSCDETGIALYDTDRGLLGQALFSQVELHALYGGVVPELASRDHVRRVLPLIRQVLEQAGVAAGQIDGVAYTAGPGLAGALLVGASTARALAFGWGCRRCRCIIWKAICWRRCWRRAGRSFRLWRCWLAAATPCCWKRRRWASTCRWANRLMTPPAKLSTRSPR